MFPDNPDSSPQFQCVMEVSEPFVDADGKLMQTILSTHSDGFTCLQFDDVDEESEPSNQDDPEPEEPTSYPEV